MDRVSAGKPGFPSSTKTQQMWVDWWIGIGIPIMGDHNAHLVNKASPDQPTMAFFIDHVCLYVGTGQIKTCFESQTELLTRTAPLHKTAKTIACSFKAFRYL